VNAQTGYFYLGESGHFHFGLTEFSKPAGAGWSLMQRWVLKRKDGPVFIEPKLEINKRIFCVINSQEIFWNA